MGARPTNGAQGRRISPGNLTGISPSSASDSRVDTALGSSSGFICSFLILCWAIVSSG